MSPYVYDVKFEVCDNNGVVQYSDTVAVIANNHADASVKVVTMEGARQRYDFKKHVVRVTQINQRSLLQ